MGSILFEHNRKAYVAAVEMMARTGRAAVIHPTGTGKSFIALQLCADNPQSRVCLLSPSEYIFTTQMEKWVLAGGETLKNIQFITYARLMRMGEDELSKIKPDYIVLDEFHRCGAAQWGRGVERLRGMYPEAKVLGLSATNIRYLDNQRDMAWELFGGNVASELTLGAAVACGILPVPKYVLSVYAYQKELQRYEMRVRQARNKVVRDKAEKELEALRRALEKADGLDEVFARHMLPETGKRTGGAESADAAMYGKY
ncbi:MAG: DEAD/DEAH box helicase family protein, partial [Lachnospiraceae bacterium]|nr:DEAD/DEAH box helicase family protein [Lachnospiraceae bacterium]